MENIRLRLQKQEAEVKELEAKIYNRPEFQENTRFEQLRVEHEKLLYRENILLRSIEEMKRKTTSNVAEASTAAEPKEKKGAVGAKPAEKSAKENTNKKSSALPPKANFTDGAEGDEFHSYRVLDMIISLFEQAIRKAFPNEPTLPTIVVPGRQTDYQCNSAMPIAQKLSTADKKLQATEVAKLIVENLPQHEVFGKIDFSGPGFINITTSPNFVTKQIREILLKGVLPPKMLNMVGKCDKNSEQIGRKVIIDFSSPNIAKEMHVGHLRSTIIGDSMARLLEYVGFDVLRLNHLGDWGTQFGMLIAHLQDIYPDYKVKSPPIGDLLSFYKASKVRFDEDAAFKQRAYECVVKLQAYDPDIIHAWKMICDVSRKDFEHIYKELDVKIIDRGESFYQSRMIEVVRELDEKKLLKLEEGRKVMFLPDIEVPMTIVKTDGSFTYDTSDMATIKQRLVEEKGDWLIYVIDSGQGLHMQSIFAGAKSAGWIHEKNIRIDHMGFGVVLDTSMKKLKTREGKAVRLRELLDEGLERSMAKLKEKGRHEILTPEELQKAQKSVAYGCIKYADLSHNRTSDYIFSFDRMLDDRGNTAAYLLYAYTRIRSIARTAGVEPSQLREMIPDLDLNFEGEERELKLAKCIIRYSDVLARVLDELMMHTLCEYMYNLATTFTDFYDRCYCVEKDKATGAILRINYRRIALCEATANVLKKCFEILGIEPLDRM